VLIWLSPTSWGLLTGEIPYHWKTFTIFCLFSTLNFLLLAYNEAVIKRVAAPFSLKRKRREASTRISALSELQRRYLWYLKAFDRRQFQAWINDETIQALQSMGIIEAHERTDSYFRFYSVHPSVWEKLPDLPDENVRELILKRYATSPPWDPARHSGRI
jgi:hypothetical protein